MTFTLTVLYIAPLLVSLSSATVIWYDPSIEWIQYTGWTSPCETTCTFTPDSDNYPTASAVLYDRHTALAQPPSDKEGKTWIDYNTDATTLTEEPSEASLYDIHINFLPTADIQATFSIDVTQTNTSIDTSVYATDAFISALLTNCPETYDARMSALDAISASIPTASFGECLHNTELPYIELRSEYIALETAAEKYQARQDDMFNNVLRYKFFMAFEDADEPYYVTEKAFNALKAGVVPVYMGTSDVSSYLPLNSYVDIRNFETIQDMNNHLSDAFYDDSIYLQYHEWRQHMGDPDWMPAIGPENSRETALCRLCTMLTA